VQWRAQTQAEHGSTDQAGRLFLDVHNTRTVLEMVDSVCSSVVYGIVDHYS
jgi:hypothetical protein